MIMQRDFAYSAVEIIQISIVSPEKGQYGFTVNVMKLIEKELN